MKANTAKTAEIYTHTPDVLGPLPHHDPAYNAAREAAHAWFDADGWDVNGRIEIPVSWGQQDILNHINNVNYARFVESSRMRWLTTLSAEGVAGLSKAEGTSIILKDQLIRFRAPVTYPDSIIWAAKPHSVDQKNARFILSHAGWSVKDNKLVATAESTLVVFDYANGRKGVLSDELCDVFEKRRQGAVAQVKAKL